ncbi:hypothetical protein C7I85_25965 [Mesorhizobium soli]|uniref:Uncharacterized protein n=2 Tax=Pseudaminobacter soli (ex Li et al. 2025) TaxID=1295366 RepID=A0A2P7S0G5_9HYPH|nr:hypothetical protein C7I85_25965 [Mesorhizobium soli]
MRVDKGTLYIDVAPSPWMDLSDCTVEISANVPNGNSVSIVQMATLAKLNGDFSSVTIASNAGDVALDGHATSVAVKGEAIKARIELDRIEKNENIDFDVRALDVYLGFGQNVPISYTIAAEKSFVDSSLSDTPGSKPAISIKGSYVRATMR